MSNLKNETGREPEASSNSYLPDRLIAPGAIIEEYLAHAGFTRASLAERIGMPERTINEIIKAESAITAEIAIKLARTLGRPAHFWSNLESQYQEDKMRFEDKERLNWLVNFPVNDMAKLGWIEKHKDKAKQLDVLLRFFAVASPVEWETVWGKELRVAFRKSAVARENTGVISAWLRQGEIEAVKICCGQFDRQKFQRNIGEISKLTLQSPEVFVPKLESLCAEAGVAIVFIHALPRLGVYGATRWMGDKPVMQLSLYLKTNDHFWFTFFHESCHILRHRREGVFIEGHGIENEYENEADAFARDSLIPSAKLRHFLAQYPHPELYRIKRFAESINTAPGIVVGRLQHDKVLPITIGNKLKARYKWADE